MTTFNPKLKDIMEVESHYTIEYQVASLQQQLNLSSSSDEEEVILEACYSTEKANMNASKDSFVPF